MATQPEELYDFAGLPRMGLMDLFKSIASGTSGRDVGRMREKRKNFAQDMARKKALQEAIADPSLKVTAEERALTEADIARQLNEQAARDEMAADRAAVNRDLARPFPSVNPNPKPQGVMDMENALYGSMYESQTPPPPPPPKEISEEQRKFRESFALPESSKSDLKEEPDMDDPIVKNIANMLNPPKIKSVSGGPTSGRGAVQDPGFLSRAGRGILDYLSDPVNRKSLAIGFNAMTLNPDRGFQAAMQSQIENIQDQRALQRSGNSTARYLESMGLLAEAEAVRQNPAIAADILELATNRTSAYGDEAGKIAAKRDEELVTQALTAESKYKKSQETLQKLDGNTFNFGPLAQAKTSATAFLNDIPGIGDALRTTDTFNDWLDKAQNMQEIDRALQAGVFSSIQELGIGARGLDTPAERQFLVAVVAGDTKQMESTLRALLAEKMETSRRTVDLYNQRLERGELKRFETNYQQKLSPISTDFYQNAGESDEFAEFKMVN